MLYQHPLAHLFGPESAALLHAFAGSMTVSGPRPDAPRSGLDLDDELLGGVVAVEVDDAHGEGQRAGGGGRSSELVVGVARVALGVQGHPGGSCPAATVRVYGGSPAAEDEFLREVGLADRSWIERATYYRRRAGLDPVTRRGLT
jgi:hypothetical protein